MLKPESLLECEEAGQVLKKQSLCGVPSGFKIARLSAPSFTGERTLLEQKCIMGNH